MYYTILVFLARKFKISVRFFGAKIQTPFDDCNFGAKIQTRGKSDVVYHKSCNVIECIKGNTVDM